MPARLRPLVWPLVYVGVALAVAGPLLAPGYVFALDHAMGPASADYYSTYIAHNQDAIQSKGAYALVLLALDALLPLWLAQKVLLFLPFFLAGYGAHRLATRRVAAPVALFGGLLYALSPFAYVRGVAGQVGVLWAYALAPWFLRAWLAHVETGSRKSLAAAVLLVAATLVFQAHGAALLALLVAAHVGVRLARAPREWRSIAKPALALAAWTLVVNAYWLVPVALSPQTTLSQIGEGDREFFATTAAGLPSVGAAALTLQGFWREAYRSPYENPWLLAIPALVLLLCVHGLRDRSRRDDAATALGVAGAVGLVLGVGASSRLTAWLFDAAWDLLPPMRGFRDAHKLLALLALAYAYLAPIGLASLLRTLRGSRIPRHVAPAALALLLLAPLAAASPLLNGYGGQLRLTHYPDGWGEVESATRECDGALVVLPWHLYVDPSWLRQPDRRVTNPAKVYFSCPTFTSDDLELGDAASQASTPQAAYVAHWMRGPGMRNGSIHALGNLLSPANVQYVLLLKEVEWESLAPALDAQRDLRLVLDNPRARLYESTAERASAWRTDVVVPIDGWDELARLSETRPLAGVAFPMHGELEAHEGTREPASPGARGRWLIEAPPPRTPDTWWRLDDDAPSAMSLGFSPVFEAGEGRAEDAFVARVAAPAWTLSACATLVLLAWSRAARLSPKQSDPRLEAP